MPWTKVEIRKQWQLNKGIDRIRERQYVLHLLDFTVFQYFFLFPTFLRFHPCLSGWSPIFWYKWHYFKLHPANSWYKHTQMHTQYLICLRNSNAREFVSEGVADFRFSSTDYHLLTLLLQIADCIQTLYFCAFRNFTYSSVSRVAA